MELPPAAPAYTAFQRVSRWSRWSDERLTRLGRLSLVLFIGACIFTTDPSRTSANALVAILSAIFLIAFLASVHWRPRLRVHRELPVHASVGIPFAYRLHISNDGTSTEADLEVHDRLVRRFPSHAECAALRPFVIAGDNWFDRRVGFRTWVRIVRLVRGGEIDPLLVPPIPRTGTTTVDLSFVPLRRGSVNFSSVEFARPDPFGLLNALRRISATQSLTVVPRQHPMPQLNIPDLGGQIPVLRQISGAAAGSQEFHALREYRVGDPLRHVHWRVSAKRGIPVVKQFVDGHHRTFTLILDAYALALPFELLIEAAASVITATNQQQARELNLIVVEPAFEPRAMLSAAGSARHLLERLAHLAPSTTDVFPAASARIMLERQAALVFLTTHWDPSREQFASQIAACSSAALTLIVAEPEARDVRLPTVCWLDPADLSSALAQVRFAQSNFHRARAHG